MSMRELDIEAKTENLDQVLAFVDEELEKYECGMKTQMQIDIAVEEIFVNIAHYAYNPAVGKATIRIEVTDGTVSLTFIDNGIPYDPLAKEDPDITLSAEERQIGGMAGMRYKEYEFTIEKDGVLFLYTDGVAEATDTKQELFGIERTLEALNGNEGQDQVSPEKLLL